MSILLCANTNGEVIFESATLANEGQTSRVGTVALADFQHLGSRFHLDQQAQITRIGGHFIGGFGTFFGALVALDGPDDFPSEGSMFEFEAIAYNTFSYSEIKPSVDFRMPLSVVLDPGDYAIVFGSGLFGTDGEGGVMTEGQVAYPEADFIMWNQPPYSTYQWRDGSSTSGKRFVVEGEFIPEPATLSLLALGAFFAGRRKR